MKCFLVLFLIISFSPHSQSGEEQEGANPILGILAVSKYAGACGILGLQAEFQSTTKLEGGDEFLVRFWTTEAARLGMSMEEYGA
tara:strand:+ start:2066 stop:2320 length:255 start_codon:yes stop_codon:yes gene_type:complete